MYRIIWDKLVLKDLKLLNQNIAKNIVKKVENHLCHDPQKLGKPLAQNLRGLYRYRFGDYRVIYEINRQDIVIIVVKIGHRKDVYQYEGKFN